MNPTTDPTEAPPLPADVAAAAQGNMLVFALLVGTFALALFCTFVVSVRTVSLKEYGALRFVGAAFPPLGALFLVRSKRYRAVTFCAVMWVAYWVLRVVWGA